MALGSMAVGGNDSDHPRRRRPTFLLRDGDPGRERGREEVEKDRKLTLSALVCSAGTEMHGDDGNGVIAVRRCRGRREAGDRFAPSGVDSFGSG